MIAKRTPTPPDVKMPWRQIGCHEARRRVWGDSYKKTGRVLCSRRRGKVPRPGGREMNERNAEIRRILEAAGFRYKPSPKGQTTVRPVPRSVADKLRSRLGTDKPEDQGD